MGFECPHCSKGIEGIMPKSRFDEVYNERKALKASLKALESERDDAIKAAGSVDEWKTKAEQAEQALVTHQRRSTITDAGFSSDLVDAVEWAYSKVEAGEDGSRPELGEVLKGWSEDPETAPTVLRPHLGQRTETKVETTTDPKNPFPPNPRVKAPDPDQGRKTYGKSPKVITAESITSSSKEEFQAMLNRLDAEGMRGLN